MTLRIDVRTGAGPATIALHGWLSAAEVEEFEKTVAQAGVPLFIDLGQLAGVDVEGRRSLCRQARRGASLTGMSPYIRLLLDRYAGEAEGGPEK
jgi:hypothetical protein